MHTPPATKVRRVAGSWQASPEQGLMHTPTDGCAAYGTRSAGQTFAGGRCGARFQRALDKRHVGNVPHTSSTHRQDKRGDVVLAAGGVGRVDEPSAGVGGGGGFG